MKVVTLVLVMFRASTGGARLHVRRLLAAQQGAAAGRAAGDVPHGLVAPGGVTNRVSWLKIADEADAWIKMTESRRTPEGPN
jgi:hypothetical protein